MADLKPSANTNSQLYEKKELEKLGNSQKVNTSKNAKNASKSSITGPSEFIAFENLKSFGPLNGSIYSQKQYKDAGLTNIPNTKKSRVGPNEAIYISDMKPFHPTNVYIYAEDQLVKVKSIPSVPKKPYNDKKAEKYTNLKKKCKDENEAYTKKLDELEEEQRKKAQERENAKSGKARVLSQLNLNSNSTGTNDLVMEYLINHINKPVTNFYNINCNFMLDTFKQNIAYFIENVFNYRPKVREGWFQLMYLLKNIDYKSKKNGFGYKSYTEFVYKQGLLTEKNRNEIITTTKEKIKDKMEKYNENASKNANANAVKMSKSTLSNTAKLIKKTAKLIKNPFDSIYNKAYNLVMNKDDSIESKTKTKIKKTYYTALEDSLKDEGKDKIIFNKILKELSNAETGNNTIYKQDNYGIMSFILQNKLQNKENIKFDDCFLTPEDVENIPPIPNINEFPNDYSKIKSNKISNNKFIKYYQYLYEIEKNIENKKEIENKKDPAIIIPTLNDSDDKIYTKIITKINEDKQNYQNYVSIITKLNINEATITEQLKTTLNDKDENKILTLNIHLFNLSLFLLYTYYILSTDAYKFSYIFSFEEGSTYKDAYYSKDNVPDIDIETTSKNTLNNIFILNRKLLNRKYIYDQSFYRCNFYEVPSGISRYFQPLDKLLCKPKKVKSTKNDERLNELNESTQAQTAQISQAPVQRAQASVQRAQAPAQRALESTIKKDIRARDIDILFRNENNNNNNKYKNLFEFLCDIKDGEITEKYHYTTNYIFTKNTNYDLEFNDMNIYTDFLVYGRNDQEPIEYNKNIKYTVSVYKDGNLIYSFRNTTYDPNTNRKKGPFGSSKIE